MLLLADLAAIALGFGLAIPIAGWLRGAFGLEPVAALAFLQMRGPELALLAVLALGIFAFGGLYRRNTWELDELRRVVGGVALVGLFDATLQVALVDHNSRLWALAAYPMVAVAVVSLRMAVRALPAMRAALTAHVVLIGRGATSERLTGELRESRSAPVELIATLPLADLAEADAPTLTRLMGEISRRSGAPLERLQLVLAPAADEIVAAQPLIATLNAAGRSYAMVLPFTGIARNGLELKRVIGADMVMAEMRQGAASVLMPALKRVFDLVMTGLGLAVAAPVLAGIAVLLAFEGGPVLFSQTRVGRGGRRFSCLKFRTMRPDAQARLAELLATDPDARAEWAKYQKLQDDPRITPVGRFLRRTSLDELPQLLNVLKGEMSLVGPRPIIAPEIEGYPGDRAYYDDPDFVYYKSCTPGLTGLWQVCGRNGTTHRERVRLDRWYARNWSIWLDLLIVLQDLQGAVLGRGGSA